MNGKWFDKKKAMKISSWSKYDDKGSKYKEIRNEGVVKAPS